MDARVCRTLESVQEALLALLKEMPLKDITVTKLCLRSKINRATFYKYYESPVDLLIKMENERFSYLSIRMAESGCLTFPDTMQVVLEDVKTNLDFYLLANRELLPVNFSREVYDLCYESNLSVIREKYPDMSPECQNWIYHFIAAGCDGIFHEWAVTGMKEPIPVVIDFARDLVNAVYGMANTGAPDMKDRF